MSPRAGAVRVATLGLVAVACASMLGTKTANARTQRLTAPAPAGIQKIDHVVVIVQENRSFDHYFGTYPGADGIPMANGTPTVCAPDPGLGTCVVPYHDPNVDNMGGPHSQQDTMHDIDHGRMDGFVAAARQALPHRRLRLLTTGPSTSRPSRSIP